MKECCIFSIDNPKEAFEAADFELVEQIFRHEDDMLGAETSFGTDLVRCRKCGALCRKEYYNCFDAPPFGDRFRTEYIAVEGEINAERTNDHEGRKYVMEIYEEFGEYGWYSDRYPKKTEEEAD